MAIIELQHILAFRPDADPIQVGALIDDALAAASAVPGFNPDEPDAGKAARALKVLRWAIIRRLDAGSGAAVSSTETAGPFTHTQTFGSSSLKLLTGDDLAELRTIWRVSHRGAWMINTGPRARTP